MGVVRRSDGRPQVLPSEIEALARVHNLTIAEAEILSYRVHVHGEDAAAAAADALKAERVEYRPAYEQIPATPENHPLQ